MISERPKVICDTGHNPHAMQSIVQQLEKEDYQKLWVVIGMVGDKDVDAVLALPKQAAYIFCQPNIPRALSAADLSKKQRVFYCMELKLRIQSSLAKSSRAC